jgi:hypothetical protein
MDGLIAQKTGTGGRAVYGVGLRPFGCWDRESYRVSLSNCDIYRPQQWSSLDQSWVAVPQNNAHKIDKHLQRTGLWNDAMSTVEITEHRMRLFSTIKDKDVIHGLWINALPRYCPNELKAVYGVLVQCVDLSI